MKPILVVVVVALAIGSCGHSARPVSRSGPRRVGEAMLEVGMRFERAGRAVLNERWELAAYDVDELEEIFEDDLFRSKWMGNTEVARLAREFTARSIPALRGAVRGHDHTSTVSAAADAARSCNACHRAAGLPFIQISESLGASVPVLGRDGGM